MLHPILVHISSNSCTNVSLDAKHPPCTHIDSYPILVHISSSSCPNISLDAKDPLSLLLYSLDSHLIPITGNL